MVWIQSPSFWSAASAGLTAAFPLAAQRETFFKDRLYASVLTAACGDALGVPVEASRRDARKLDPVVSMRPSTRVSSAGGALQLPAGTWSDDTSMTLALMDSLTRSGFSPSDQAATHIQWLFEKKFTATGDVFSVGGTTYHTLLNIRMGYSLEEAALRHEESNGNGSLMRTHPLIFFGIFGGKNFLSKAALKELFEQSCAASAVTHAHPRSQLGCGIATILGRYLLAGFSLSESLPKTKRTLMKLTEGKEELAAQLGFYQSIFQPNFAAFPENSISSREYVVDTLEAGVWCLLNTSSLAEAILRAANLGGDADTTAAVTGALGGIIYGLDSIPKEWLATLAKREEIETIIERFYEKERKCPT